MPDQPLDVIVAKANEAIAKGGLTFQKFTCAQCGSRQMIDQADTFYITGRCQECSHVTDLQERGCGFAVLFTDPETRERVRHQLPLVEPLVPPGAKDFQTALAQLWRDRRADTTGKTN